MKFREQLRKLKRLDGLISRSATGSPEELARRLDVSKPSIFRYINELKSCGAEIKYDSWRQSYRYEEPFSLDLNKLD